MFSGWSQSDLASAELVYVGRDVCFRTPVLERAGYRVQTCVSVEQLERTLQPDTDALLIEHVDPRLLERLVDRAHSLSAACVVLFEDPSAMAQLDDFDLVIPAATPPDRWLPELGWSIEHNRMLRLELKRVIEGSVRLRAGAQQARMKTRMERLRAAAEQRRQIPDPWERLFEGGEEH